MANGGVIAPVGINMVALAAQRHAVPFVVVAGSHKVRCFLLPSGLFGLMPIIADNVL